VTRIILTDASVGGVRGCTVVAEDGLITEITTSGTPGAQNGAIDANGGAVLPALWDHHVHLFAAAARAWSVNVAEVRDVRTFAAMVQAASRRWGGQPVRVVGYDDDALGPLDGNRLDSLVPCDVPVRVQHRSGHQWVLNSAARLARGKAGKPVSGDGIVWGQDSPAAAAGPDALRSQQEVSALARNIAAQGCAGATDMSATSTRSDVELLRSLLEPVLSLEAYGSPDEGLEAVKRIAPDHRYPDPEEVAGWVRPGSGRVAIHTVTAETLALIVAGGGELGPHVRLEHVFMASRDLLAGLSGTGVELGIHPGFIHSHGDRVLGALAPAEVRNYQPLATMRRAGFRMFGGTDRPYGPGSVWQAMESAVTRRTRAGVLLGGREFLTPEEALALFTRDGLHGEAPVPAVRAGQPADFCVLDRDWKTARSALSRVRPLLTVTGGTVTAGAAAAPGAEEGP